MAERLLTENELIEFKYLLLKKHSDDVQQRIDANLRISKYVNEMKKRILILKKNK